MTDENKIGSEPTNPNEALNEITVNPVAVRLGELGITDAETVAKIMGLGADTVDDLVNLQESDLRECGVQTLKARKVIAGLKPTYSPVDTDTFDSVLPTVPDDVSWLNSLRTGGVLKIEQSTVISAIRAALADRFGLYIIPKKLLGAMEEFVEMTEEQVGEEFWTIRKQLTRKSYGDLFQVIEGLDASYVTEGRKNELLSRINESLWPSIINFNNQLVAWQEAWMQGGMNPGMMMAALGALAGGGGGVMPPGMMQPPDCGVLRDASATVNDALNRTFRGTGVQITAALAYEANQIKAMLENSRLPMLCGVPSRDLLLKKLGVSVPATYPRMEQNLSRFVLGIMQADRVAGGSDRPGNDELQYFGSLYMLGSQIPWDEVNKSGAIVNRPKGIGCGIRGYAVRQPAI